MKAFISFSLNDGNDIVVTLLASKLREKKFAVTTSQNFYSKELDAMTMHDIYTSHLFVGMITGTGKERRRVLEEWEYAVGQNIPNLLLVEDTVPVHQHFTGNYVRFNRHQPGPAIEEINRRMDLSRPAASANPESVIPWILGGAALLAIIAVLARRD